MGRSSRKTQKTRKQRGGDCGCSLGGLLQGGGALGPMGPPGPQGPPGPEGPIGPQGPPGESPFVDLQPIQDRLEALEKRVREENPTSREVLGLPPTLGGYRATRRNREFLRRWKKGIPIGFTATASLKAKGLIPRTARKTRGKKIVSPKYK